MLRCFAVMLLLIGCCDPAQCQVPIFRATGSYARTQIKVTEKEMERRVVLFTAPYCTLCRPMKDVVVPELKRRGVHVTVVDITEKTEWADQVQRLPTFWIVENGVRAEDPIEGSTTVDVLEQKVKVRKNGKIVTTTKTSSCSCSSACVCGCQSGLPCQCGSTTQSYAAPKSVLYRGVPYSGRVCDNPRCSMCNQIESGLRQAAQYQPMSIVKPEQQPTPDATLHEMVDSLGLSSGDLHLDVGSGDGRVLVASVQRYGCSGVGIEIDPAKVDESRRLIDEAGLSHRITIIEGDALKIPLPKADAVTAFLYPDLLEKLSPRLRTIPARVVVSPFHEIPNMGQTKSGDLWIASGESNDD